MRLILINASVGKTSLNLSLIEIEYWKDGNQFKTRSLFCFHIGYWRWIVISIFWRNFNFGMAI